MSKSITEIDAYTKALWQKQDLQKLKDLLDNLASDQRVGIQKLHRRYQKKLEEYEQYWKLFSHEIEIWDKGFSYVAGVDEAGRGPVAGPVVAAAVVLNRDIYIPGLKDSKKLSANKREEIAETIKKKAVSYSVSSVSAEIIDELNILRANHQAMAEAVLGLAKVDYALIDGQLTVSQLNIPQSAIIKGDNLSNSVAAASVLAKVARDTMMVQYDKEYPEYGFAVNKGYLTKEHQEALRTHGPSPIHRKSFSF